MDSASYGEVVGHIYDAVTAPEQWSPIMERLADLTGGHSAWLSRLNLDDGSGSGLVVRMDPAAQARYFDYYNTVDPLCNVDDSKGRPEPPAPYVITDENRLTKAELLQTEFYNDFMAPIGAHSVMMLRLAVRGMTVYGLNINRSRDRGRFEANDLALARSLQGHVTRSLQLAQRFESLRLSEAAGLGLRFPGQGMVLLDGHCRVVFADALAERLLRRENGLLVAGGRLGAVDGGIAQRFQALVSAAAASRQTARRGGSLVVPSRAGGLPLFLAIAPLQLGSHPFFGGERCVIVSLTAPDAGASPPPGQLADLFGLTEAEGRVTRALLCGRTVREVAIAFGVSPNTIRTHLARILEKTGVRRQSELVRLLARLPGLGDAQPADSGAPATGRNATAAKP